MRGGALPGCQIRAGESVDAAAIAAIHRQLFDPPWDADGLGCLLKLPAVRTFIAEAAIPQAIAGFIVGQLAADEAEILSIGIAPVWQRRGIAGRLIERFAASVARSGAKRLFLEVAADNAPALAFYRQQGFHNAGRRSGYYERRGATLADALVLTKTL
jgi:ribosomal-protein-alanine N-acetyltransferase